MSKKFEYLRENEFLRKTILACLSGAQMGSIHEKNRGQKSRDTAPLTAVKASQLHVWPYVFQNFRPAELPDLTGTFSELRSQHQAEDLPYFEQQLLPY